MAKPKPFPKSMAACADLLYTKRTVRLAADKAAAALKEEEDALINHIVENLPKDSAGAIGRHHKIVVYNDPRPRVTDWDKFWAYVAKNKRWDMLQKRISDTAVADTMGTMKPTAAKKVLGVEVFNVVKVSLTKVGK